jgi:hypothetical protein
VTFLTFKRHYTGQESSEFSELSVLARQACTGALHYWGILKTAPMANTSKEYFNLILSLQKLEL